MPVNRYLFIRAAGTNVKTLFTAITIRNKLVHEPKFAVNLSWFKAPKLMFGEGAFL